MSAYTLTAGSTAALRLIASMGGTETLLLVQPERDLRPEITIEPMGLLPGAPLLEAVVFLGSQRHSMRLQRGDNTNVQHLAEWVEAIANGTLDTAEAIPQRTVCTCPSGDGSLRHPCPAHPAAEAAQWLPEDEVTLRRLARNTGSATLSTGTVVAVHGTSHTAPRTAIVVHGSQTHLVSGQWRDVYLGLSDLAEQLLTAA